MKTLKTVMACALLASQMIVSVPSWAIKKCQDAEGKWHYGDVAVSECENSKITTLNSRGFITDQKDAPKTEEELLAEQQALELAKLEADKSKQREQERLRILSIYETEDDIDRQRDNQINSVQGNIDVHKAYLKNMRTRVQRYQQKKSEAPSKKTQDEYDALIAEAKLRIQTSEQELEDLLLTKKDIIEKFVREKDVYLSIKKGPVGQ